MHQRQFFGETEGNIHECLSVSVAPGARRIQKTITRRLVSKSCADLYDSIYCGRLGS